MASDVRQRAVSHLTKSDLVPHSLANASTDALDHDAVAAVVADLVTSVEAPANVALFGPWGSGKSSLYGMVSARVARLSDRKDRPTTKVVRYDAWKFGGPSLQRNFLTAVAEQAGLKPRHLDPVYGATETTRIRLWQFLRNNPASIFLAFLISTAVAAVWVLLKASMAWYVGANGKPNTLAVEVGHALPSGMVVLGVVIAGLLLSNQTLSSAVEKRTHSPMQDADQFYNAFSALMKILTKKRWLASTTQRLVVFIDELDRCTPDEVSTTLTDLLTFLDHPKCVFVVAADREALEEAIEKAPQAKPIRADEPYYSTAGAFLDKIFQHQMSLPPMRPEALTVYARGVADAQGGLWEHLRDLHDATYDDVVYSLVPAHVRSPRRVKVLLNNYATNIRVMEARGLDWDDQAVQVAVFTVLQTEFASVLRDFMEQPRILHALTGQEPQPAPAALQRLINKYAPPDADGTQPTTDTDGPSPLLTGDDKNTPSTDAEKRAIGRLNQQLHDYLGRIAAASIEFPSLDLAYLQRAGHADGIDDTDFARALDAAADVAPATTIRILRDLPAWQDQSTRVAAIRYLVAQMSTRFGPLRDNLVEVAALIANTLTKDHAAEVARSAAPRLLQEASQGRWRTNATTGALRLALLDTQMGDPFAFLPEAIRAEMHQDGVLEFIVSHLPELPAGRARWTYPHLAAAYAEEADYFLEALKVLPPDDARELWTSQLATIRTVIENLPEPEVVEPPAGATARQRAAAATMTTATPESVASERASAVQQVFETLMARPPVGDSVQARDTAELWAAVIDYATDRDRASDDGPYTEILDAVYRMVSSYASVFMDLDHIDSGLRNTTACNALIHSPDLSSAVEWGKVLDFDYCPLTSDPRALHAHSGRVLVAYLADPVETDICDSATGVFGTIAELLAPHAENAGAAAIADALKAHPPSAANDVIRRQQIGLLKHIVSNTSEPAITVSDHIRASLEHALNEHALPAAADLPYYISDITTLDRADADQLADTLRPALAEADNATTGIAQARLLIAANQQADKAAINPNLFLRFIDDGAASQPLVLEWMNTTPPASMVSKIARQTALTATSVRGWGERRNITERSKLWLTLERHNYHGDVLRAVGSGGVNRTVVDRMAPRILEANLNGQPRETHILTTADLSARDARVAAHDLAATLLDSGVAGSVPNAIKILIAANGGDPARRDDMKRTLEAVKRDKVWKRLYASDRQALTNLRLVTPEPKLSLLSRRRR